MPEIKTLHSPCEYNDVKKLRNEYLEEKCLLVSLEKFKNPLEAKKLTDYLIGMTYAKEGMAFQYKKVAFFSFLAKGDPKDLIEMSRDARGR